MRATKRVVRWTSWVAAAMVVAVPGVSSAGVTSTSVTSTSVTSTSVTSTSVTSTSVTSTGDTRTGGTTAVSTLAGAASPGQVATASRGPAARTGTAHTVTLVTGDVVRVGPGKPGREQVSLVATPGSGPGSVSDSIQVLRQGKRTYVIPDAARPYVLGRKLDPALFDVTTLVADGYDDRRTKRIPLIVTYAGSPAKASARARSDSLDGARRTRVLSSIGAAAVAANKADAREFWESLDDDRPKAGRSAASVQLDGGASYVWLDRKVHASLDQSVPQIGAPAAWARGFTGQGVTVAVADTGVDDTHPDLAGKVVEQANFSDAADAVDHYGHGTHVASIVAGTGAGAAGRYKGVAPDARLLSAKVLDDSGSGAWSGVIAGLEWAAGHGADVVNLSLGGTDTPGVDPVEEAVNTLTEQSGTLFVVAAGNEGPGAGSIGTPGSADAALTVGAVDKQDEIAFFSSRGPRVGDAAIKPEVTAPGVDIVAAKAAGTELGDPVGEHYVTLSGTSMATPHVAGAAAILLQQHPSWKPDDVRARLMSTAKAHDGLTVFEQGAGRIDVDRATTSNVQPSAGKLELGYFRWPHDDVEPVSRELTYTNDSDAAVTLDLSVAAAGEEPVPASALSLDKATLTVPAKGSAAVTVRLDPSGLPYGSYGGVLTATIGGTDQALRTPVGWHYEAEMYDLTVEGTNRDGTPMTSVLDVVDIDDASWFPTNFLLIENGRTTLRLPAGRYSVGATVVTDATDDAPAEFVVVTKPDVDVHADTTTVLDARRAKEVTLDVKGAPETARRSTTIGYARSSEQYPNGYGGSMASAYVSDRRMFAVPTAPVSLGRFEFVSHVRREAPPITLDVVGAPALDLNPRFYPFGPRANGKWRLPLATFPGGGSVEGAVALIARHPDISPGDQALAAQEAGARAALFYDPETPGRTGEWWWYSGEELDIRIPGIVTSRTAAAKLEERLAQGKVSLDVTAIDPAPYVYDLAVPVERRVPDQLTYRIDKRQLARLDVGFGAHGGRRPNTSEDRVGITPAGIAVNGLLIPTFEAPHTRTDYVLAGKMAWTQAVMPYNHNNGVEVVELPRRYRAGQHLAVRWQHPVATDTLPAGDAIFGGFVKRTDSVLDAELFTFVDQKDRADGAYGDTHRMRLLRDGELVGESEDKFGFFDVPDGPGTFRLELDSSRSEPWWRYSTAISSAWTFRSTGEGTPEEPERLPLLLVDYDVPQADLANRVHVGKPVTLSLGVRHQYGSDAAGTAVAAVTLDLSYDDGETWTSVPVKPGSSGSYTARVVHPASAAGGAVTLRVDVRDRDGNRLEQTVTRAYGLR